MGKLEEMIKVGITGQEGFMGSHLYNYLGTKENIELVSYDISFFNSRNKLKEFVRKCDIIIHLAALNRHEDQQVIYDTNVELVNKLITSCEATNSTPKIIFSSSTQEESDNLYGKSKLDGRKLLEDWAKKSGGKVTSFIIPNVFGPFGEPFYNSFIATFCHQIVNEEKPTIHNDGEVNLIYINDLAETFYQEIKLKDKQIKTVLVPHNATKKVSEILNLLVEYKSSYMDNGVVTDLSDPFELALFNTFATFIPRDYFPRKFIKNSDHRGSFIEIMRANTSGQSSYSITVPGITRGNHYHTRKVERFAVISGKARIQLRKINTDKVINYELDGNEPSYVDMPVWFTHNITNIGNTDLITMFWINEPYNPDDPDTYFIEV